MISLLAFESSTYFKQSTALMMLMTEMSTPFLNYRWFLYKCGYESSFIYVINGACLWISFLIFRIIDVPIVMWELAGSRNELGAAVFYSVLTGLLCIYLMNFYWFYLITEKLVSIVYKRKEKPSVADKIHEEQTNLNGSQKSARKKKD